MRSKTIAGMFQCFFFKSHSLFSIHTHDPTKVFFVSFLLAFVGVGREKSALRALLSGGIIIHKKISLLFDSFGGKSFTKKAGKQNRKVIRLVMRA